MYTSLNRLCIKLPARKKETYVQDDAQLSEILIDLGIEDVILKAIESDKEIAGEDLGRNSASSIQATTLQPRNQRQRGRF